MTTINPINVGTGSTAGQVLQSAGSGVASTFSTATYPSTFASGDIVYASAANTLTALSAPSFPGAPLMYGSGAPLWGPPNKCFTFYDDFILTTTASDWNTLGNIDTTNSPGLASSTNPGVATLQQNAVARSNIRSNNTFFIGGGRIIATFIMKINTLSTAAHRASFELGFATNWNNGATNSNGITFTYSDNVNSAKWLCHTTSTGTDNAVDSGVTADTNWHNFTIDINAAGSSVTFYIDGNSVATSSTNVPSTSSNMQIGANLDNSVSDGTLLKFGWDMVYIYQQLTTAR